MQQFRTEIVTSQDLIIPHVITNINLDDANTVSEILVKARKLKQSMPYSTLLQISRYDIYNLDTIDLLLNTLEKESCLSVLPREVLHRAYPDAKLCSCNGLNCP